MMTNRNLHIQGYCHIRGGRISLNGEVIFADDTQGFSDFMKSAYKKLEIAHSKFFKMDNLSKLAFMGAEVLLKDEEEKDVALIFSNRASSLDTDRKHQSSISDPENHYPSPAIFVYTLPNICLGEISIRHGLHSENSFFIFDRFSPDLLFDYANNLLANDKAKKTLCGWVDFDQGKYESFLYVVAKNGTFTHSIGEINRLY